jgi:hypothetical protein
MRPFEGPHSTESAASTFGWRFPLMTPGAQVVDPVTAEFFNGEGLETPSDALVRETIQNSLDARIPGRNAPVRVRYTFSAGATERGLKSMWLSGLEPHLRSRKSGISTLPAPADPLTSLLIEDYGTTGLTGDPSQWNNVTDEWGDRRNNFFFFWRAVGATGKGVGDKGSWGLGKSVLPASSRINSIIGLSCQHPDCGLRLFGLSVLKHHAVEGGSDVHVPYGYFGRHDGGNAVALPIEDPSVIASFCESFGADRRGEPGLSIAILLPNTQITGASLVASAIVHYFYPILAGQLIVEVKAGGRLTVVDATTIEQCTTDMGLHLEAHRIEVTQLKAALELARWSIEHRTSSAVRLGLCSDPTRPQWEDAVFAVNGWDETRQRFNRGLPVEFEIPVRVSAKGEASQDTSFLVALKRSPTEQRSLTLYLRDGITVRDVKSQVARGVVAFVTVDGGPLAAFLRDAENPAHTLWRANQGRLAARYERPRLLLSFVIASIGALFERLTKATEGLDADWLADLFSVEEEEGVHQVLVASGFRRGSDPQTPRVPPLPNRPEPVAVAVCAGGVVIKGCDASPGRLVSVELAYDVRRGNAFQKWSELDFELGMRGMRVENEGVTLLRAEKNRIEFAIDQPSFSLRVLGFDDTRDVRVRVDVSE